MVRFKYFPFFLFIGFLTFSEVDLCAQTNAYLHRDTLAEKSQFRIRIGYISDYIYMGRSDSAKAPYVSTTIGYHHKSGVYLRSSVSYLTGSEDSRIDVITFTGGYEYFGKNLSGGASLSEYFFNDQSFNVQAEMNTYLNGYIGYDFFSVVTLYIDASVGFSENADVFLGGELTHTFYAIKNNLLISPYTSINFGTQQYYNSYYQNRSTQTGNGGMHKGKGSGPNTPDPSMMVLESDAFKALDYEAGVQFTYRIKKLRLFTSATATFPVNPATLVYDQGEYEEDLKNSFFWLCGIRFIF